MRSNRLWLLLVAFGLILSMGVLEAKTKKIIKYSPAYNIDIGLSYTAKCRPYSSVEFSNFAFTASFHDVRFLRCEGAEEGINAIFYMEFGEGKFIPGESLGGEGGLVKYNICPAWDTPDKPIQATITHGPNRFEPTLGISSKEEAIDELGQEELSQEELVMWPMAPQIWLRFYTGFRPSDPPTLAWKHEDFSSNYLDNYSVVFSVPLQNIMNGEEISFDIPYESEDGKGKWSIGFYPINRVDAESILREERNITRIITKSGEMYYGVIIREEDDKIVFNRYESIPLSEVNQILVRERDRVKELFANLGILVGFLGGVCLGLVILVISAAE